MYIRSNYKWFLKNKLLLPGKTVFNQWSSRGKFLWIAGFEDGTLQFMNFKLDYTVGPFNDSESNKKATSQTVLLHGRELGMTPLSLYAVPPPLTHLTDSLNKPPCWLAHTTNLIIGLVLDGNKETQTAHLILKTHDGEEVKATKESKDLLEVLKTVDPETATDLALKYPRYPLCHKKSSGKFLVSWVQGVAPACQLVAVEVEETGEISAPLIQNSSNITFGWIDWNNEHKYVASTGVLTIEEGSVSKNQDSLLPVDGSQVLSCIEIIGSNEQTHRVVLTSSNQLYLNNEILIDDCTSVCFESGFLLFTTMTQGLFDLMHLQPEADFPKLKEMVKFDDSSWPMLPSNQQAKIITSVM